MEHKNFFLCGAHLYGAKPTRRLEHRQHSPPYDVGYCHVCNRDFSQLDEDGPTGGFVTEAEAEAGYEAWIRECAAADSRTFSECLALIAEQTMGGDFCGGRWYTDDTVDALERACRARDEHLLRS